MHQTYSGRLRSVVWGILFLMLAVSATGCGEKEKTDAELVLGNWTLFRNRAYILLVISQKGTWNSSVRIADVTSKIVSSKGNAQGSWHLEEGQLIFTVVESDIEEIWEKNDTSFFEIIELGERVMLLREENGRVGEWKRTTSQQAGGDEAVMTKVIPMKPYAVNLNKHSSNEEDRYLCLNMNIQLKELMPDQEIPKFHPRARDAVVLFLSSLVYEDVANFDKIKEQRARLVDLINPYMEGFVKDVEIEHVIIASSINKVEEFIIEHTIGKKKADEGAEGDGETKEDS